MLHRDPSAALRKSLEDPPILCKDEAVKVRHQAAALPFGRGVVCYLPLAGFDLIPFEFFVLCFPSRVHGVSV